MPRKRPTTEAEWEAKRAADRARYHANPLPRYISTKKWTANNRDKINAARRKRRAAFRAANPLPERKRQTPEEVAAKKADYRKKNARLLSEKQKQRRRDNYEVHLAKQRASIAADRGKHNAKAREWKKKNPVKVAAANARREAKKKKQLHPDATPKKMQAIYSASRSLSVETGVAHETDHIIPIDSGGWHHEDNLQSLPEKINGTNDKGDNPFWLAPSMAYKDWRDVPRHLWPIDLVPKYLALIEKHKGETIRWDAAA